MMIGSSGGKAVRMFMRLHYVSEQTTVSCCCPRGTCEHRNNSPLVRRISDDVAMAAADAEPLHAILCSLEVHDAHGSGVPTIVHTSLIQARILVDRFAPRDRPRRGPARWPAPTLTIRQVAPGCRLPSALRLTTLDLLAGIITCSDRRVLRRTAGRLRGCRRCGSPATVVLRAAQF